MLWSIYAVFNRNKCFHIIFSHMFLKMQIQWPNVFISHIWESIFPGIYFLGNELFLKLSYISNVAITHVTAVWSVWYLLMPLQSDLRTHYMYFSIKKTLLLCIKNTSKFIYKVSQCFISNAEVCNTYNQISVLSVLWFHGIHVTVALS